MSPTATDTRGLAGQTIGETQICSVNQTQLIYRGYEIADLAANASFEEVSYLLLVGHKLSGLEHLGSEARRRVLIRFHALAVAAVTPHAV